MKKIIAFILAMVLCCAVFAGCSSNGGNTSSQSTDSKADSSSSTDSDLDYIVSKGTLIVGITEYEPMNYQDENKEWTGFDTEFAQAVAKKLGVEAQFIVIDWDNKFLELDAKSIDCIWNGMTITDEVKNNSSVSDAYVENAQVVVMTKENADKYKDAASMAKLSFAAEAGSAGEAAIKENNWNNYTAVTAQTDALMEVASGSADACVVDITMANAMTGKGTSYENLTQTIKLNAEQYGIAFRKGSDATAKVNEIMAEFKTDGTLDDLAKKYQLTLVK